MSPLIPLALILLSIPLVITLLRANELFVVRRRAGRMRVVRGRIPQRLLDDIDDVLRTARVDDAELKAVIEDGRARFYAQDQQLSREVRQRLRNTISLWPVPKIRNAPKRRR